MGKSFVRNGIFTLRVGADAVVKSLRLNASPAADRFSGGTEKFYRV
jgi:hypothetical protein